MLWFVLCQLCKWGLRHAFQTRFIYMTYFSLFYIILILKMRILLWCYCVAQSLILCVMFCRSLSVLLSFFFCPLYCLSLYLRLIWMVIPWVFSYFPYMNHIYILLLIELCLLYYIKFYYYPKYILYVCLLLPCYRIYVSQQMFLIDYSLQIAMQVYFKSTLNRFRE